MSFAPEYFRHVGKRHAAGQRTCLAKIVGAFTVTIKPMSGEARLRYH